MSYTHCPTCQRAFNLAIQSVCPYCPVAATAVDASEDIVAAAELLARAMTRATPAERDAAAARLGQLALPGPQASGLRPQATETLRRIRATIAPPPTEAPKPQPLWLIVAHRVIARIEREPRLRGVLARVRALAA
jgi:hypothetical protein